MKNKIKEDIEQKTRKLKKQLNKEPSNLTKVKDNKRAVIVFKECCLLNAG